MQKPLSAKIGRRILPRARRSTRSQVGFFLERAGYGLAEALVASAVLYASVVPDDLSHVWSTRALVEEGLSSGGGGARPPTARCA